MARRLNNLERIYFPIISYCCQGCQNGLRFPQSLSPKIRKGLFPWSAIVNCFVIKCQSIIEDPIIALLMRESSLLMQVVKNFNFITMDTLDDHKDAIEFCQKCLEVRKTLTGDENEVILGSLS